MATIGDRAAAAIGEALQRAMNAIQNRRPDQAEAIAREVSAKHPQHPGALHVLGLALLSQQRPRDAVVPLEKAARLLADPVIETHLGIALRQTGRNDDALTWLQQASGRRPVFWLAFHELGLVLLSLRRVTEAQATVQRGLELAPAVPETRVILGTICLDRADWAGAKSAFARALGPGPAHANALYGLGAALMYDNEFAPAAEHLKQAVGIDPTYAQAWIHYGLCLLELGEWEKGIACLRRAIEVAPRMYDDALKTLVTTGRGRFPIRPSAAAKLLRPQPQP